MAQPSLSDLTAFATVARHRSFRAAADVMGVSRSALSHALRGLEEQLGVRLLHRTTRSVAPTEAGERLLARLSPLLRDLGDMLSEASDAQAGAAGPLRINAPEGGGRWLLRHVVPRFLEQHPRVALEISTEGRFVDIVADGFDAGVRLREAVPQDMVIMPFGGSLRFLAVAAPAYVARQGQPDVPDDLKNHSCIRQRLPSGKAYRWEFSRNGAEITIDVPSGLTLDHNGLMVAAAEDGLGIAFVPETAAAEALARGSLVALLEAWSPPVEGLCLYYPGHRHVPAALRAFLDCVRVA
jgi:DNA-binding transcriptional LysR family regulator